jgi:hypothetical protein
MTNLALTCFKFPFIFETSFTIIRDDHNQQLTSVMASSGCVVYNPYCPEWIQFDLELSKGEKKKPYYFFNPIHL